MGNQSPGNVNFAHRGMYRGGRSWNQNINRGRGPERGVHPNYRENREINNVNMQENNVSAQLAENGVSRPTVESEGTRGSNFV